MTKHLWCFRAGSLRSLGGGHAGRQSIEVVGSRKTAGLRDLDGLRLGGFKIIFNFLHFFLILI
jgi:hypothetical protein